MKAKIKVHPRCLLLLQGRGRYREAWLRRAKAAKRRDVQYRRFVQYALKWLRRVSGEAK